MWIRDFITYNVREWKVLRESGGSGLDGASSGECEDEFVIVWSDGE
jgi:hypothetical protein